MWIWSFEMENCFWKALQNNQSRNSNQISHLFTGKTWINPHLSQIFPTFFRYRMQEWCAIFPGKEKQKSWELSDNFLVVSWKKAFAYLIFVPSFFLTFPRKAGRIPQKHTQNIPDIWSILLQKNREKYTEKWAIFCGIMNSNVHEVYLNRQCFLINLIQT